MDPLRNLLHGRRTGLRWTTKILGTGLVCFAALACGGGRPAGGLPAGPVEVVPGTEVMVS